VKEPGGYGLYLRNLWKGGRGSATFHREVWDTGPLVPGYCPGVSIHIIFTFTLVPSRRKLPIS